MLNRELLADQIKRILLLWRDEIELNGKLNLLNGNVLSEDLYASILNLVYDFELINLNGIKQNATGADLIDYKNKILMQVTSTTTQEKRKNTVEQLDIEGYQGYTLYMVYISKIHFQPKKMIANLQFISFDIEKHIIDLTEIMSRIMHMNIYKLNALYDLVLHEIGNYLPTIDNPSLSSDLVAVLSSLSKNNFKDYYKKDIPLPFKIKEKIKQNNLEISKDLITDNHIFYELMQNIYDTYDSEADNTSYAVWEKIADFGREISMIDHLEGDQLFTRIWKETYNYVKNDQELKRLSKEKIENCIKIIVVDAFMRCKILKKPIEEAGEQDAGTK